MSNLTVIADSGEGGYGFTIILRPGSLEALAWLRSVFLALASGTRVIRLDTAPEMRLGSISQFELRLVQEQTAKRLVRLPPGDAFRWSSTSTEWREVAALLDPLLEGESGHQYLTNEGKDDALVEVSFAEPDLRVDTVVQAD